MEKSVEIKNISKVNLNNYIIKKTKDNNTISTKKTLYLRKTP